VEEVEMPVSEEPTAVSAPVGVAANAAPDTSKVITIKISIFINCRTQFTSSLHLFERMRFIKVSARLLQKGVE
jgi:hypothetical protein